MWFSRPVESCNQKKGQATELTQAFALFQKQKRQGCFMFLKLDMEKAFDKMKRSFLLAIMEKLGFRATWINWIRLCISSPSFSILLNGSPFGLFYLERGLRQVDPLFSFLFILGSKVLSRFVVQRRICWEFKRFTNCKTLPWHSSSSICL